jgi:tRNA A37 N6-isopentenylltransferase MiaA
MAVTITQIQARDTLGLAVGGTRLLLDKLLHGWSPFAPRVRTESLASYEASRLIPSVVNFYSC